MKWIAELTSSVTFALNGTLSAVDVLPAASIAVDFSCHTELRSICRSTALCDQVLAKVIHVPALRAYCALEFHHARASVGRLADKVDSRRLSNSGWCRQRAPGTERRPAVASDRG